MLGFDAEMVKVEHEGSRVALVRLVLRGAQGGVIGGALGLATVFVVPSEFLLPIMVMCGAAGALLNIRLTSQKAPPIEVQDTSVQALVVVRCTDLDTATMILRKEGSTAIKLTEAQAVADVDADAPDRA